MKDDYEYWFSYFSGKLTSDEKGELERWIEADSSNREHAEKMCELWEDTKGRTSIADNKSVDRAWAIFYNKHDLNELPLAQLRPPVRRPARRRTVFTQTTRILVALLIPVLAVVLWQQQSDKNVDHQVVTYSSDVGERVDIRLNDGSTVYLSVNSELKALETFSKEKREVELTGEAYFEIAKDANRPFVVNVGGASIQVLGTEFNVRSYDNEENVNLVVTEGRVAFYKEEESIDQGALVTAGYRGIFNAEGDIEVNKHGDLSGLLSWREGKLQFEKMTVEDVISEIQRWYDVIVTFEDEAIKKVVISTAFDTNKRKTLSSVLDVVTQTAGIQYRQENNNVLFYNN